MGSNIFTAHYINLKLLQNYCIINWSAKPWRNFPHWLLFGPINCHPFSVYEICDNHDNCINMKCEFPKSVAIICEVIASNWAKLVSSWGFLQNFWSVVRFNGIKGHPFHEHNISIKHWVYCLVMAVLCWANGPGGMLGWFCRFWNDPQTR